MKFIILFIFCIMSLVNSFSQVTYFMRPVIETKAGFNSSDPFRYSDFVFQNNDLFHYENMAIINPFRSFSFNIGGFVGLNSKNKKNLFELGLVRDQSEVEYRLSHQIIPISTDPKYNTKYPNSTYFFCESSFSRLTFQYSFLLNKNSLKKQNLYLISGLSFVYKNGNAPEPYLITYSNKIDSNKYIRATPMIYDSNKKFTFIHLGFTGSFSIKTKYLFDFSIFVNKRLGDNNESSVDTKVEILENNSVKETYGFTSYSKGTGVYFQLSRKFQFYPWLKKGKEE